MKIAILGTRGIPNNYGGFEQFAEYLSVGLVERGHSVTVYNTHFHEYRGNNFNGVEIYREYSPENKIGAAANFIYDYLCLKDALKKDFDIIYELGYHSNAPSYYILNRNSPIVITNMDGIEWKRSKWNFFTRKLIKQLEKIAVKKSNYLISDNIAIKQYYSDVFNRDSFFIPYGANFIDHFDSRAISSYSVSPQEYFLIIARLEPENNIEMVLDGYVNSRSELPFLVIGNKQTKYGIFLQKKYANYKVIFLGDIYDKNILDNLRHYALLYFHGHSVGGTNPSLLEAMAAQALIAAHKNKFNQSVLNSNALYFENENGVTDIIRSSDAIDLAKRNRFIDNNNITIREKYSWAEIITQYETLFKQLIDRR